MYQALYRKWRPKTFDDVVGQAHISETLKRQVELGRLSHAYLFVGTRGTGKTTCAKILSRAINCQNPQNGNPCNRCPSCLGIMNGSILDVLEIDAASNNGVDNVRALRDEAVYTPVDVKKRVYIIDEVHMLSGAAFNALLKILEEPPEHLVFILATTEIHKVPATILSRCQRFTFKRIGPDEIMARLRTVAAQEGLSVTDDAAAMLARLADGSLRDALSLLDQCAWGSAIDTERVLSAIGLAGSTEVTRILSAVADGDAAGALTVLDRLYDAGKVMASVLEELADLVRDVLVLSMMPGGGSKLLTGAFELPVLEDFRKRLDDAALMELLELLREALSDISKNNDSRLFVELCLLRLCARRTGGDQQPAARHQPVPAAKMQSVASPPPQTAFTAQQRAQAPSESKKPPEPVPEAVQAAKQPQADTAMVPDGPKSAPVQATAPTAAASAPAEAPSSASDNTWDEILKRIKPVIEVPSYMDLTNPTQSSASIVGKLVTIIVKNKFAQLSMTEDVKKAVKDAATTVLGLPVEVRVVLDESGGVSGSLGSPGPGPGNGNTGPASSKLDAFSKKFPGVVTFEEE